MAPSRSTHVHPPVPIRTILAVIGLLLGTVATLYVVVVTRRVLTWILIAAFFAVALYPAVAWVQKRLPGGRWRPLATLVVFLVVLLTLAGVITAFAVPVAQESSRFAGQLPDLIEQARTGQGPVGDLLQRTNALQYVQDNQERIRAFATGLTTPVAGVLRGVATGLAGTLTVFVLAYLMVLEGPKIVESTVGLFAPETAARIRSIGADCAKSVTGYISGNLLISVICGILTYIVLAVTRVPFAALIALFVAISDLIPLVGATLGAVVAGLAAFIHSVPAGIIVVVFFILYQQVENHLLQPLIFSRTVKLNPLTVLIAILLGVELAGILGALLAIPIAGVIQVVVRDIWQHHAAGSRTEHDEVPGTVTATNSADPDSIVEIPDIEAHAFRAPTD